MLRETSDHSDKCETPRCRLLIIGCHIPDCGISSVFLPAIPPNVISIVEGSVMELP
jgi:hypothetical protein